MSTFKRDYMKHDIFNISFALHLLYSVYHLILNKNNVGIVSESETHLRCQIPVKLFYMKKALNLF